MFKWGWLDVYDCYELVCWIGFLCVGESGEYLFWFKGNYGYCIWIDG